MADPAPIRRARAADIPALARLAMRSKAVWGYDDAFMAACRDELTLTEAELAATEVAVIDGAADAPLAMVQVTLQGSRAGLHKLFVDPEAMGQGYGRQMMTWAMEAARRLGAVEMEIEADPGAAPFYTRMGAKPAGTAPSGSIPGRVLPRFLVPL